MCGSPEVTVTLGPFRSSLCITAIALHVRRLAQTTPISCSSSVGVHARYRKVHHLQVLTDPMLRPAGTVLPLVGVVTHLMPLPPPLGGLLLW